MLPTIMPEASIKSVFLQGIPQKYGLFSNFICVRDTRFWKLRLVQIRVDTIYDTTYNVDRKVFIMSKWDKLLTRICTLSKDLRFDELRKVLESYGYEMNAPKGGSSHYTFRKPGCQPITIPKHEPIKKVYVEMVKQIVESEANNDENAE